MEQPIPPQIEMRMVGCVIEIGPRRGILKPGIVQTHNRKVFFDEFVVGVTPGNPYQVNEAFIYLLDYARSRLNVIPPDRTGLGEAMRDGE